MNILRVIKLKELNGNFNKLNTKERFLFSLFNKLIIDRVSSDELYFKNERGEKYFYMDFFYNDFKCYYEVMNLIMKKFDMKPNETEKFIVNTIKKEIGDVNVTVNLE